MFALGMITTDMLHLYLATMIHSFLEVTSYDSVLR